MMVTKYYNQFIELAQYFLVGNANRTILISRFMRQLRKSIADKIIKHHFSSLMNGYTSAQLAEANINMRIMSMIEHAIGKIP